MKNYQSARPQSTSMQNEGSVGFARSLQTIQQYSYNQSAYSKNNPINVRYKTSYHPQRPSAPQANCKEKKNAGNIPAKQSKQQLHRQDQNDYSKPTPQKPNEGSSYTRSRNQQKERKSALVKEDKLQPEVLVQKNRSCNGPVLFAHQQSSVKEKLKQNAQQQMLSNYYINKYSRIMSKMTNQMIRIQLPSQAIDRPSVQSHREKLDFSKNNRQNFKQVMKRKNNSSIQNHNTSLSKSQFPTYDYSDSAVVQENKQTNQIMAMTFITANKFNKYEPPTGRQKDKQIDPEKSINKRRSLNEHRGQVISPNYEKRFPQMNESDSRVKKQNSLQRSPQWPASRRSPIKDNLQIANSKDNYKISNRKDNLPVTNRKSRIVQNQNLSNRSYLSHESHSQPRSPKRQNFKQTLLQHRTQHSQFQSNFQLYKRLETSIINQLYSPQPKRIEDSMWRQIQIIQKDQKQKQLSGNNSVRDQGRRQKGTKNKQKASNIQVYDNQDDIYQFYNQAAKMNYQQDRSGTEERQIELIRQKIRKSIQNSQSSRGSISVKSSSPQKSVSPSRRAPLQSPRRSLITQQHLGANNQLQQRGRWNSNFSAKNSFNKGGILDQSTQIRRGNQRQSSPDKRSDYFTKTYGRNRTADKIRQVSQGSRIKSKGLNAKNYIKQEEQSQSDLQRQRATTNQKYQSNNQVANKFGDSFNLSQHVSFQNHQRKNSFHSMKQQDKKWSQQRPFQEKYQTFVNQNQSANDVLEENDEIQFIPAANENAFELSSSPGDQKRSVSPNARRNLIQTVGQTRSRKPSQQLSFISDHNGMNHNELSMLSRFSMTSEQGSLIVHKLQQEITQNQFGPYQYALQSLRELLYENSTAWPIYVVGQRILDDRMDYQKKIELQSKMIKDYEEKIRTLNQANQKNKQTDEEYSMRMNKTQILRLIRQIAHQNQN